MFWKNKKEKKEQDVIVKELQELDDIFHRSINALERLEMFLDGKKGISLVQTSAGDKRDFHDPQVDRGEEAFYDELAFKCNVLFKAAKFDDEEVFKSAAEIFVKDILEWYAGRENLDYNAVDAAFVPLFVAITRQAKKTKEVDDIFDQYVYKSQEVAMSIDEKYEATKDMVEAWIRAQHWADEGKLHDARESEKIDIFTSHKRGNAVDGFKRLFSFATTKFDTTFPAKLLVKTTQKYAPEITNQFKDINEESIEKLFEMRVTKVEQMIPEKVFDGESKIVNDVPFEIANDLVSNETDTIPVSVDEVYPQLVDAVKRILEREGIAYHDIKITII